MKPETSMNEPSVQQELLQVISERLIPWAQQGRQPIILGRLPLHVPEHIPLQLIDTPPLKFRPLREPSTVLARWPDRGLAALRAPHLGCVLDGEADHRIGAMEGHGAQAPVAISGYNQAILTLPAQSWIVIPPGVPQSDGTRGHREPSRPPVKLVRILWINVLAEGVILHTCETSNSTHTANAGIFAKGTQFSRLTALWIDELEQSTEASQEISRLYLLVLLQTIEAAIHRERALPIITAKHSINVDGGQRNNAQASNDQVLERALCYINSHLKSHLTVDGIASKVYVSAPHLNRLFRARLKSSVMEYVTQLRLQAACNLLTATDLPVREIGERVGYANPTYFSRVFLAAHGISPVSFRRQSRMDMQVPATKNQWGSTGVTVIPPRGG